MNREGRPVKFRVSPSCNRAPCLCMCRDSAVNRTLRKPSGFAVLCRRECVSDEDNEGMI